MKYIATKLRDIEKKMSEKKGAFNLFALFMREDAENKWDLLVSSKWISKNKSESLKYIASNVQDALTQKELVKISRIVIIDNDNSALDAIHQSLTTEHSITEIRNSIFFGLPIQHAYIITSQKID
jgi:hypothetical protein